MSVQPVKEWKQKGYRCQKKEEPKFSLRQFSQSNQQFIGACQKANVKPTRRQASKWHQGRGLAYQASRT